MSIEKLKTGDIIIEKGTSASNVYIIINGTIQDKLIFVLIFSFFLGSAQVYENNECKDKSAINSLKLGPLQFFSGVALFLSEPLEQSLKATSILESQVLHFLI
jgi:hypothetical protein